MAGLSINIATIDSLTGDERPLVTLAPRALDLAAIASDPVRGLPQWHRVSLPSGEELELLCTWQEDGSAVSVQVRIGSFNIAAFACDSPSFFKFLSTLGQQVVLEFQNEAQRCPLP